MGASMSVPTAPPPALYVCPVCHRDLKPTLYQRIPSHFDTGQRDMCPATGYPYRIMVDRAPETVEVWRTWAA